MNGEQIHAVDALLLRSWQMFLRRQHEAAGGDPAAGAALDSLAEGLLLAIETGDPCLSPHIPVPRTPVITVIDGQDPQMDGTGNPPVTPLVLDGGMLYLQRLWLAEQRVALQILELDRRVPGIRGVVQPAQAEHLSAEQAEALSIALSRSLLLLTGGPGTGKTFTLARILVALAELDPSLRIAIAAPTGKAAARLSQALADLQPGKSWAVQTVHALLGSRGAGTAARHGRDRPLPHDIVVIDEASMLGLELAESLLSAVGPMARLILAGDADQLSSVEPGNVFADLIAAGTGPLTSAVLRLTRNYRQSDHPEITRLAAAIQAGDLDGLSAQAIPIRAAERPGVLVERAVARYQPLLQSLLEPQVPPQGQPVVFAHSDDADPSAPAWSPALDLLRQFTKYRMLTALRSGPWGSVDLAAAIDRRLSGHDRGLRRAEWYNGRLVALTRNLRAHGLVNGDIGLGWLLGDMPGVVFDLPAGPQWLPVSQLPGLEPAWCLTVHKAQGSEFDEVDLVLAPPGHTLARRELVYTGVTRARRDVTLWGEPGALASAAATPMQRRASLYSRIVAMRA